MLSISDQHSSPLNHQQHFSPVQMGGAGFQRQRRAALGKRACPLLSMEKLCKLDGHATGGLLRKCPPPAPGRARALLSAVWLQTLGLILVPASHLGIGEVGGEVEEVLMLVAVVVVVVRTRYR